MLEQLYSIGLAIDSIINYVPICIRAYYNNIIYIKAYKTYDDASSGGKRRRYEILVAETMCPASRTLILLFLFFSYTLIVRSLYNLATGPT